MRAKKKEHEQAIKLRQQSWSLSEIANELKVAKSSVSLWVRNVKLTPTQQRKLDKKNPTTKFFSSITRKKAGKKTSETWRNKRREYQKIGEQRIKDNNPLYIAGCMLYWAEGYKHQNTICFTNSDPDMLKVFIKFLKKFWEITDENIRLKVGSYIDIHSVDEIREYWLSQLNLSQDNLNKIYCIANHPTNRKTRRCEWGTCQIATKNVSSVAIIQEIHGAVKEYANIEDENKWLG